MRYIFYSFWILSMPTFGSAADELTTHQSFFTKYCAECHGVQKQKGGVRFDELGIIDAAVWKNVYEQLASEAMPPDNKPQPTATERSAVLKFVLELATKDASVISTGFRRLNKREYGNTVRDLLGLHKGIFNPGEYIYEDEVDEGFDTAADSLVLSNELLLEYMAAAEKSLRHALFTSSVTKPDPKIVDVSVKRMKGQGGSRYVIHLGDRIILRSGGKGMVYAELSSRTMELPGRYTITVTASGVDRDFYPIRFAPDEGPLVMGFGVEPDDRESVSGKGQVLKTFELQDDVDQTFQFDTWIDRGHFPYFSFVNGSSKPITQVRANIRRGKLKPSAMKQPYRGPGIQISQFKIHGPFLDEWPPESFKVTYGAKKIPNLNDKNERLYTLGRFATRAFRRSVTREEMTPWRDFMNSQYAMSRDRHDAVIKTFTAMMASVDFLYLREEPGELDNFALANRLSYFLWSTMPDDELFKLAKSGKLKEPAVLSEQVLRMLDDPRSERFSQSFADQWLALDTLGSMPPDAKGEFREYYRQNLEPAMLEETHRFFRHVLHQNRSVRDFIDSDYSFVNKGLAELYGVTFEGEGADDFQRVTFPAQAKRGGLLGHGSILTLSANGVETSPIERGVWVLAELLGTPPPPPPKEVPALTPDLNGAVTVREMLEKHRSDPACMECHRRMDPLGFALEAYDPIGRLRTKYSKKQSVSTHGNYLGKDFADVTELKQILSSDIRPFARNLIIRITEYAKGRKLVTADYATVQQLVDESATNDFKFKDIVITIANSDLMTNR